MPVSAFYAAAPRAGSRTITHELDERGQRSIITAIHRLLFSFLPCHALILARFIEDEKKLPRRFAHIIGRATKFHFKIAL